MQIRNLGYAIEPIDGTKDKPVRPHPRNARRGDLEAIEASIAVNGFFGAIVVQDSTGFAVVGNHRWRAAKNRQATEIPVIRIECTDLEAERMAAADNRTHDLGGYDTESLVAQLGRLADSEEGLAGTGYNAETFAAMQEELDALARAATDALGNDDSDTSGADEPDADDDLASLEVPSEPITKRGDLWLLGDHRLLCGDSFNVDDRRVLLRGEKIDLVLMDPPYAIYGSSTGIGADIADDKMVRPFFETLFRFVFASVREFAHVYICCDWRSWAAIWESAKAAQLSPKNCIIWDKGSSGLGSNYANTYEMIGYFARLPPATAMKSTTRRGQRTVHAPNVARYNRVSGAEREHNAAKPRALMEWLIGNSSDPGELVVDFFGGSGTTLCAAEQAKRRCYMMEMEPRFCDVIVARWERLTGRRAKRVPVDQQEEPIPSVGAGSKLPSTKTKGRKARGSEAPAEPEEKVEPTP